MTMPLIGINIDLATGKAILNNAIRPRSGECITSVASTGSAGRNADIATYAPVVVPRIVTVTHLHVVVTAVLNLTDVTVRFGLHADDGTEQAPAARLVDSGEIPVAAAGLYTYALPTPLVLSEGKVWTPCVLHGTLDNEGAADPACFLLPTDGRDYATVVADPAKIIASSGRRCREQSGVTGALPATAAPDDVDTGNAYRVFLQVE